MTDTPTHTVLPVRGNHSVKSVTFVCEFASQPGPDDFRRVLEMYNADQAFREFFPVKMEFQVGGAPPGFQVPPSLPPGTMMGLGFNRLGPNGAPDWALNITANAVVVMCQSYDRWAPALETALLRLLQVIELMPEIGINIVALQYMDEWTIVAGGEATVGNVLFNRESGLLSTVAMSQSDSWHSHSGWFQTELTDRRVLVNLNVNVGFDTVSQKYTANVTHAQRSYQQAPRFFNAGSESFRDVLSAEFNLLHLKNK